MRSSGSPFVSLLAVAMLAGSAATVRGADQAPVVIPLHVDRGSFNENRLGIDVTLGSKTQRVLFDTGSTGLRILASALPAGSFRRTGPEAKYEYGSGTLLLGGEAVASMTIGPVHGSVPLQVVDKVDCSSEIPNCPDQDQFQLEMFGGVYSGILGAYPRPPALEEWGENPLGALDGRIGRTFILHAALDAPSVTLNPAPATVADFTMVPIGAMGAPRGCIRVYDVQHETCGPVLFDTGSGALFVQTMGTVPGPPWTHAVLRVGGWSHDFTIGPHAPNVPISIRRGDATRIVVGLAALQKFDVYFDLDGRRLGMSH